MRNVEGGERREERGGRGGFGDKPRGRGVMSAVLMCKSLGIIHPRVVWDERKSDEQQVTCKCFKP